MPHDLEKIKLENPLIDFVMQDAPGTPKRSGRWMLFVCPLPDHADKNPSFGVDENQRFTCFGCGATGDLFDYLQLTRGWDLKRSIEFFNGEEMTPEEKLEQSIAIGKRQQERLEAEIKEAENALENLRSARMWIEYENKLSQSPAIQTLWENEGIPIAWQKYYSLGYSDTFWAGESLTIPIFTPWDSDPINIRHRIIGATGDKYRPERAGLPASFYWSFPAIGATDSIFLVEGEKKAMVLYRYLSDAGMVDTQVIGIMGKNGLKPELVQQLTGTNRVYLLPDPHVEREIVWKQVQTLGINTTLLFLPYKVDDALNDGFITANTICEMRYTGVNIDV